MGTQSSSQSMPQTNKPAQCFNHSHLGSIKQTSDQKFKDCFMKIYSFSDQMMAQQKLRRFNTRVKKFGNSEYILLIKQAQLIPKHQMCANNCEINLYFQKYSQNLSSVMKNRIKNKANFSQKQIYEFINSVLEALIFLQDNGFKNCHLDKQSIVICKGKIKLLDMGIANCSPYQTFLQKMQPIQGFYVAPQLLKDLKQKNYQPYLSPKSDVFCLGMIILELACMEPLDFYYNFQTFSIDYQSLIHRVSKIVYSYQLKSLIAGMLQYQSDLRLGLISAQQRVKTTLNIATPQNSTLTKRSRSSSTKMLKDLLTNSRKTIINSKNSDIQLSLLKRKTSHTSLSEMVSMNSRISLKKQSQDKKQHTKNFSELYLQKQQVGHFKNLVKNKIGKNNIRAEIPQIKNNNLDKYNKENINQSIQKFKDIKIVQKPVQRDNAKLIQQARKQSFGTRTFFYSENQINQLNFNKQKLSDKTPKMNQYLNRINLPKKEESIFRIIQQSSHYKSIAQNKEKQLEKPNSNKDIDFSPVLYASPTIRNVQQTNSIKKQQSINPSPKQLSNFENQITKQNILANSKDTSVQPESINYSSLSLKVKRTLDRIYKTAQSFDNSEQKQQINLSKNNFIYNKVLLPNNNFYEGQLRGGNIFEGNGVLYNQSGNIIYKGSWFNNLYDGFGTIFNHQVIYMKASMLNLNQCNKNWIKYQGEFSKGQRQGFGTIYFANGERFSGCMRNGEVNGYGCFYDSKNQMTSGIWINSKLQQ